MKHEDPDRAIARLAECADICFSRLPAGSWFAEGANGRKSGGGLLRAEAGKWQSVAALDSARTGVGAMHRPGAKMQKAGPR